MRTKKCVAISIYMLTREVVFYHNEIKREFCVVIDCLILTRTDLHSKKIADGSFSAKILRCRDCGLIQKKDKCLENCYAQAKVSQDDNQFVVTFFLKKSKKSLTCYIYHTL